MTYQQILYVLTVRETGSMRKAGEKLFITQPTLTSAVKSLEDELSIQIFTRTGKGVQLTPRGKEFITYARGAQQRYDLIIQRYKGGDNIKYRFSVSAQHYSFAVKAFIETVKRFGNRRYEYSIKETKTLEVIEDVATAASEVGVLYLSDYNRKYMTGLFRQRDLEFQSLAKCDACVYLWKGHPLAKNKSITFEELKNYPCLSFEQGEKGSFYLSEEILLDKDYDWIIKTSDRATMFNLMLGLNGFILCSGVICEELNGRDYVAIPYRGDRDSPNSEMELGYITKTHTRLTRIGTRYVEELKKYFE